MDALTASRYATEPVEDRSGTFLPSEPAVAEATEDEQFDAYMATHFGQHR